MVGRYSQFIQDSCRMGLSTCESKRVNSASYSKAVITLLLSPLGTDSDKTYF